MRLSRLFWITIGLSVLILIPFALWESRFAALTEHLLDEGRPRIWIAAAVVALLGADVVLPIPSSLISTSSGYLLGFWRGLAASWLGMTAACVIGYGLGRFASTWVKRSVSQEDEARFARASDWVLATSRAVPMLAEASVVVAGMLARPFGRFFTVCALANLGISAVYAVIGAYALHTQSFLLAFAGAVVVPGLAMRWLGRR
ncbi:MAG: VTT domain-containing protein [Bryobacterales bacterium]|nr:VTT domain-containing protein [Bryobacterales bacterium]